MAAPAIDRLKDRLELGRYFNQALRGCKSISSSWKEAVSYMLDVAQLKAEIHDESYLVKRTSFGKDEELDLEKMRKDPNYYADYIKRSYEVVSLKK